MAAVIRSPQAQADIDGIADYVARDNLAAATRLVRTLSEKLNLLAEYPGLGPRRPEIARGLRSFPVGSYLILYRVIEDGIEVVRILHGARDLRRQFGKRKPS